MLKQRHTKDVTKINLYNYEQVVDLRYDRNNMEKLSVQEGFIKDFLEVIIEPKPPYTTLASTIKNLERKEFVTSEKIANSFRYKAAIKEEEYKKRFMNGFVSDYFENSYKDLVTFFAKDKKISASELKEIIKMIENPKS
jgi:BlaI family penicillinase repressor